MSTKASRDAHEKAYKFAIENDIMLMIMLVRFNYIGLPRSGKTSFRRRMMKEIKNLENEEGKQPSTGVAENGGQIFIRRSCSNAVGTIRSSNWSTFKGIGGEYNMLSQLIREKTNVSKMKAFSNTIKALLALVIFTALFLSPMIFLNVANTSIMTALFATALFVFVSVIFYRLFYFIVRYYYRRKRLQFEKVEISEVINQALKEDWSEVKFLLDDTILLINTDTGGQAEFLDLQSSLVHGPSFNLLFWRLMDKFDDQFKINFTNEFGETSREEDSILTVEDVIFQSLSSIACFSGTFRDPGVKQNRETLSKSKVMIVGTYKDKVKDDEVKERNELLIKRIKDTPFYENDVIEYYNKDQLIIPVDNMTGDEAEIDGIQGILERVIAKSFERIRIRASWLVLSILLRIKNRRTMSLADCEKLASELRISPKELQKALRFLHHRVGIILYYPEKKELKNIVICDMQVVFDSTTNLVKNTFTFSKVSERAREQFREKGMFSLKDVRKAVLNHTDDLIPLEKLVILLKHLNILTDIPSLPSAKKTQKPMYFMPCILKPASPTELKDTSTKESDPAPLMLRYNCGYVPVGVFPCMIADLISQRLGRWKLLRKNIRKNKIQFQVGKDLDKVTLISRPCYLEIVISRSDHTQTPDEALCCHVRRAIRQTLSDVTQRMKYHFNMGYQFGFKCPSHSDSQHLCVLSNESAIRMECLEDENETLPLLEYPKKLVWFSSRDKDVPLSLTNLMLLKWKDASGNEKTFSLMNQVSSNWMEFGAKVGLGMNQLKAWERQFHMDANRCWLEVMTYWLNGGNAEQQYPVTWEGVYSLLTDVGYSEIARELKEAITLPVTQPYTSGQEEKEWNHYYSNTMSLWLKPILLLSIALVPFLAYILIFVF